MGVNGKIPLWWFPISFITKNSIATKHLGWGGFGRRTQKLEVGRQGFSNHGSRWDERVLRNHVKIVGMCERSLYSLYHTYN